MFRLALRAIVVKVSQSRQKLSVRDTLKLDNSFHKLEETASSFFATSGTFIISMSSPDSFKPARPGYFSFPVKRPPT